MGKRVMKLRATGKSYRDISKALAENHGVDVSHTTIKNYIKKKGVDVSQALAADEETKDEALEVFQDAIKQMRKLNRKMWETYEEMDTKGDTRGKIKVAKELRKQLENQNKLLQDFSPGNQPQQVNVQDLNVKIDNFVQNNLVKILETLEDRKLIDIKGDKEKIRKVI